MFDKGVRKINNPLKDIKDFDNFNKDLEETLRN